MCLSLGLGLGLSLRLGLGLGLGLGLSRGLSRLQLAARGTVEVVWSVWWAMVVRWVG